MLAIAAENFIALSHLRLQMFKVGQISFLVFSHNLVL